MAEIINLRSARKASKRSADARAAAANRASFGRTKGEKLAQKAEQSRQDALLDGAKRNPD